MLSLLSRINSKLFPRSEPKCVQRYVHGHIFTKSMPFSDEKIAKLSSDNLAVLLLLMAERVGFEIEAQLFEIIIENIFYFQNVIFYTPKYAQKF